MAERSIVWTKTALKQRREILNYWKNKNKSTTYPEKIIKLSQNRIAAINKNPLAFKKSQFLDNREPAIGHFNIYYKLAHNQIIITAFWDIRQDPKTIIGLL